MPAQAGNCRIVRESKHMDRERVLPRGYSITGGLAARSMTAQGVTPGLVLALLLLAGPAMAAAPPPAQGPAAGHWGLLEQSCNGCHNSTDWAGGVAFDTMSPDGIAADSEVWEKVVRKLRGHLMPPPGET